MEIFIIKNLTIIVSFMFQRYKENSSYLLSSRGRKNLLKALGNIDNRYKSSSFLFCYHCEMAQKKKKLMFFSYRKKIVQKDKEDLKKITSSSFSSRELPKRSPKKEKKHGALDNKSLCGQKNYLLENNQRHVIEFFSCLGLLWLIFAS